MTDQHRTLLRAGLSYRAAGLSLVPIDGATKQPHWELLPQACTWPREEGRQGRDAVRVKGIWQTFIHSRATEDELRGWIRRGAQLALVGGPISGGLLIIDFDVPRFFDAWRDTVGTMANGLAVQRTGGGGYQVLLRCEDEGFWYGGGARARGNEKLAWVPDDAKRDGRSIAIETRAARGYAVIAPSRHPSGRYYELLSGDVTRIPVLSRAHALALLDAATALDEAPYTRDQQEKAVNAPTRTDTTYRSQLNGQGSVIDAFNDAVPLADELHRAGYVWQGSRLYLPGNGDRLRPGVVVIEGKKSYHWDSEDPLGDGHAHTAFDVFCHFGFNGDCKEAVKAAAERLGLKRESRVSHDPLVLREVPCCPRCDSLVNIVADGHAVCPKCRHRTTQATAPRQTVACCPSCTTVVRRSQWPHPGTTIPGWYCPQCKAKWPMEAYTPMKAEDAAPEDVPTPPTEQVTRSSIIIETLTRIGYRFALNLCSDTVEVNGVPLNDITAAQIRTQMRDLDMRPITAVEDAYVTEAARNAYHPIKDYLNGLEWDGQDYIGALIGKMASNDPPVRYPGGKVTPLIEVYVRRWLVGAIAKVLAGDQNVMLVLAGPQGIGKSTLARWLCSDIPAYYIEGPINVADKDSDVRLMNRFIWEVSELDATTRKADVSALKDFITRGTVTVRRAYGRHDTIKPALASMIGTVNEGSGFLADDTGNRRFMVVSLQHIDYSYRDIPVGQVWAHAVALYRQGETGRLSAIESEQQSEQNKNYEVESLLEGWILQHFDLNAGPHAMMSSSDIADHLRSKEIRLSGSPRADAMEISRVLSRLGIKKIRTSAWRGYVGIAPASE